MTPLRFRCTLTAVREFEVDPRDYSDDGDRPEETCNILAMEKRDLETDPLDFIENIETSGTGTITVTVEEIK